MHCPPSGSSDGDEVLEGLYDALVEVLVQLTTLDDSQEAQKEEEQQPKVTIQAGDRFHLKEVKVSSSSLVPFA